MTEGDCGATLLRAARDADAADIIELIAAAYAEYPGCVLDIEADMPELKAPTTNYAARGGRFWVAQAVAAAGAAAGAAEILGCVACQPASDGGVELEKLYVARNARRGGLGGRLLDLWSRPRRRPGRPAPSRCGATPASRPPTPSTWREASAGPANATSTMPASASNTASARTSKPARFSNPLRIPLESQKLFP